MKNPLSIRALDIAIFCILLVLVVFGFLQKEKSTEVLIYNHGEVVYSKSLKEMQQEEFFEVSGCKIRISPDGVKFISSTCPNQLCVQSSEISTPGAVCACVPNGVVAVLKSEKENADIITY